MAKQTSVETFHFNSQKHPELSQPHKVFGKTWVRLRFQLHSQRKSHQFTEALLPVKDLPPQIFLRVSWRHFAHTQEQVTMYSLNKHQFCAWNNAVLCQGSGEDFLPCPHPWPLVFWSGRTTTFNDEDGRILPVIFDQLLIKRWQNTWKKHDPPLFFQRKHITRCSGCSKKNLRGNWLNQGKSTWLLL